MRDIRVPAEPTIAAGSRRAAGAVDDLLQVQKVQTALTTRLGQLSKREKRLLMGMPCHRLLLLPWQFPKARWLVSGLLFAGASSPSSMVA